MNQPLVLAEKQLLLAKVSEGMGSFYGRWLILRFQILFLLLVVIVEERTHIGNDARDASKERAGWVASLYKRGPELCHPLRGLVENYDNLLLIKSGNY